jgi:hypothetical protein
MWTTWHSGVWPIWVEGRRKYPTLDLNFCAPVFIKADFSPKQVQTMMGYASIQLTFDTYGYLFEARMNVTKATDRAEAIVMVG